MTSQAHLWLLVNVASARQLAWRLNCKGVEMVVVVMMTVMTVMVVVVVVVVMMMTSVVVVFGADAVQEGCCGRCCNYHVSSQRCRLTCTI